MFRFSGDRLFLGPVVDARAYMAGMMTENQA
jgi:hypothetical protein